jgi:hypothetical protein
VDFIWLQRLTNERATANTDDRLASVPHLSRSDQHHRCYSATYNTFNVCRHLTTARTHRILRNEALPRMDERGQRRSLMSQIEPLLGRELST